MKRVVLPASLICALLAMPSVAFSQREPEKTKEVKEAERFVTSAMLLTTDTLEKKSRLQRALNPLQQAMAKTPTNAHVWLLAGQVYAGLGDYVRADSAFRKAVDLYAPFGEDIIDQRLRAWAEVFVVGNAHMDAQRYDEAIAAFEAAELMYSLRPESKLNLGALYANTGDNRRAESFFRQAMAATNEAARTGVKPEEAASFRRYYELSAINVARMVSDRGIAAFEAKRYDDAIAAFKESFAMNPYTRDNPYNLAQSIYAKAADAEKDYENLVDEEKAARAKKDMKTVAAKVEEGKVLGAQIAQHYTDIEPLIETTRALDPNNEDLYRLLMRAYRTRADLTLDAAKKAEFNKRVSDVVQMHGKLGVELFGIGILSGNNQATVKGKLRNMKAAADAPVKIHFMLLGLDGRTIGEGDVTVKAPATDKETDFEVVIPTSGDIAGWKYEITR